MTTLQASLDAADRPVARPLPGTSSLRFDGRDLSCRREPRYRGPWRLPGPDSHRLAALSLSLGYVMGIPLDTHGARAAGRTLRPEEVGGAAKASGAAVPRGGFAARRSPSRHRFRP